MTKIKKSHRKNKKAPVELKRPLIVGEVTVTIPFEIENILHPGEIDSMMLTTIVNKILHILSSGSIQPADVLIGISGEDSKDYSYANILLPRTSFDSIIVESLS